MSQAIKIWANGISHPGGRRTNEDAFYICEKVEPDKIASKGYLYAVADGAGGHEGGKTASSLAVEIAGEHFYDDPELDISKSLKSAVLTAHRFLYKLALESPTWAEMSTTFVGVVIHGDKAYIANVGDSRAYLIRGDTIRQLTTDHIWLEDDENYGALTRWLGGGGNPTVEVDLTIEKLQDGDVIVLCTDGLSDVVTEKRIKEIVSRYPVNKAVRKLLDQANLSGASDNVTALVIRYGGNIETTYVRRQAFYIGSGLCALTVIGLLAWKMLVGSNQEGMRVKGTLLPPLQTIQVTKEAGTPPGATEVILTSTPTLEPTSTRVPPTNTPTRTPTKVPTPTFTYTPTLVPTPTPSEEPSPPLPPPPPPPPPSIPTPEK